MKVPCPQNLLLDLWHIFARKRQSFLEDFLISGVAAPSHLARQFMIASQYKRGGIRSNFWNSEFQKKSNILHDIVLGPLEQRAEEGEGGGQASAFFKSRSRFKVRLTNGFFYGSLRVVS